MEAVVQKTVRYLALILIGFGSRLGWPQMVEQPSSVRPVEGRLIFQTYCAPCHGVDAEGKGPVSGALRQAVPDLTMLSIQNDGNFPGTRVRKVISFGDEPLIPAHGSKAMPIWGPLFHEVEFDQDLGHVRLENVTSYIRSIQRKPGH
jgi:mono/diheme cytochrome c family protein